LSIQTLVPPEIRLLAAVRGTPEVDPRARGSDARASVHALATQKNARDDAPALDAVYEALKLSDGIVRGLVEGAQRPKILKYIECREYYEAGR